MTEPPGGYRLWAERLLDGYQCARNESRRLGCEDSPLMRPLRRFHSGVWVGTASDHFRDQIQSLDRRGLSKLAEDLARLSAKLEQLYLATNQAAGQAPACPGPGPDLLVELHGLREWPSVTSGLLPSGWSTPPARGTHISMDIHGVRELCHDLRQAANEIEASRARLARALDDLGLDQATVLSAVADAARCIATEILRRADILAAADQRADAAEAASCRFAAATRPLTKRQWRDAALERAGIDGPAWNPRKGLATNDKTVVRVWERYGEFHRDHPELQWAGMANLVGPTFYAGWQDLYTLRKAADSDRAKLISRLVPGMPDMLVREAARLLTVSELRWFEERFLIMQKKIFEDLAWQHEAYLSGGIAEMRRSRANGEIRRDALKNWEDIASGDPKRIARGNKAMLRHEQQTVIGDEYTKMRKHHPPVGEVFTRLLTATADSPIPGGKPYRDVVQHFDLPKLPDLPDLPGFLPDLPAGPDLPAVPRGNVAKFNDRWEWIDKDMLPAYRRLSADPQRLREIIDTPIAERAEGLRLLPLEYRHG